MTHQEKIADLFILNLQKTPKVSQILQKIGANGVFLQGPDFPQISSTIERVLGIKNVPLSAAKICTNKYKMKKFLGNILYLYLNLDYLINQIKIKLILNFRLS